MFILGFTWVYLIVYITFIPDNMELQISGLCRCSFSRIFVQETGNTSLSPYCCNLVPIIMFRWLNQVAFSQLSHIQIRHTHFRESTL